MNRKPLIGITLGDPSGIGPEVVLRALADRRARAAARFVVFGRAAILKRVTSRFDLPQPKWEPFDAKGRPAGNGPFLYDFFGPVQRIDRRFSSQVSRLALAGCASKWGGWLSQEWIRCATIAALSRVWVDAIVTGPISKEALHKAGLPWPGHTEMLATWTNTPKPVMMMVGGGLRIALVTTHAAIKDLPKLITRKSVLETIRIVDRDLKRRFGLRKSIAPAIRQARREGIACDGPIPADAAFTPKLRARHDAFVAMFHDQACIPVKMLAFDSGVNVTLGLPIIRTSPDHGTAYDIVRKGTAHPGSMVAAILLAAEMARRNS